jgi:uncharacterized membrane protein YjdF
MTMKLGAFACPVFLWKFQRICLRTQEKGIAMKRLFLTALCVVLGMSAQLAFAETQYSRIGHGRLLTNDLLGDGKDRWRTGSYAL